MVGTATTFLREVKKLAPVLGRDKVVELEVLYLSGDEKTRSFLEDLVDAIKAAMLSLMPEKDLVIFEPPPKEVAEAGDIYVGDVLYGGIKLSSFLLPMDVLLHHIGIFGSTGYGKTTLVQHLVLELAKKNVPVVIFDFSKRNYRDLLQLHEVREKMRIYTVGRNVSPFYFNPVMPPENVPFSQWSKEFAEIFDHAYWMMGGGRYIVLRALDEIESMSPHKEIRLKDIRAWIYANEDAFTSARERNWAATAKRALDSLCYREIGEAFNPKRSVNPAELFFQPCVTVLELDALSSNDRTFFIEVMLQWLRDWLLVNSKKEELNAVIVVEEAHHILNREKTKKLGTETVTDVIFREIRELGVGIIYTDQHPSLMSYTALGNTSTQLYMNLGLETKHASDVDDAACMLNLVGEEEKDFLRRLKVGEGLVFCRKIEFTKPFYMRFPKVEIEKGKVRDGDLRDFMEGGGFLLTSESETDDASKVDKMKEKDKKVTKEKEGEHTYSSAEIVEKLKEKFNTRQIVMLKKLARFEAAKASDLYKNMGMSGTTFKRLMRDLVEEGVVDFEEIILNGQNAHIYFIRENWIPALRIFVRDDETEDITSIDVFERFIKKMRGRGWCVAESSTKIIVVEKDSKKIFLLLDTDEDSVRELLNKAGEVGFVLVADRKNLNRFLQNLAKIKKKENIRGFLFRVGTIENMMRGERLTSVEI